LPAIINMPIFACTGNRMSLASRNSHGNGGLEGRGAELDGELDIVDLRNYLISILPLMVLEAEPGMQVWEEEIFGPVRCFKKVSDLAEAVELINRSTFGHTAVIYTENGAWAREFIRRVNTGQVGVNVGTPAPIAFYPVGGRKTSMYGDIRGRGPRSYATCSSPAGFFLTRAVYTKDNISTC